MPSPRERIKKAAILCFTAYAEYSRAVYEIDVQPAKVRATYEPGRGARSGWTVNGRYFGLLSAEHIERQYLDCAQQWHDALAAAKHEQKIGGAS